MEVKRLKTKKKTAFSIAEFGVVILVIGIIIALVSVSSSLIRVANLSKLRQISASSPIYDIGDVSIWLDVASKEAFSSYPKNGDEVTSWFSASPYLEEKIEFISHFSPGEQQFMFDSVDGLPLIKFYGSLNFFSTASDSVNSRDIYDPNEVTIFLVQNYHDTYSYYDTVSWSDNSGCLYVQAPYNRYGSIYFSFGDGDNAYAPSPAGLWDKWNIITLQRKNTGVGRIRVNSSNLSMYADSLPNSCNVNITDTLYFGQALDGKVREFIIFKKELTDDEIEDVEKYLATKWQIDLD